MEGLALALVPPGDSDFVFVSPINEHCPIGGARGGGGKGGVFASGKTPSFALKGGGGVGGALTAGQKSAVGSYKDGMYNEINGMLRGTKTSPNAAYNEKFSALAKTLGEAVNHGITTKAGVVYRSVAQVNVSHAEMVSKVGQKITLKGFMSTSTSKEFAANIGGNEARAQLRIYVPKGATALSYSKVRGGHDSEHEVILPHNSTFTVHAVGQVKGRFPGDERSTIDLIMHR